ncbi:SPOR domain-containing protein [Candidatus Palauibacter sp.]|uniref:SPOR domain-containing protein n=1 Tax=Candidatus Palauibacter sp. TaxID=3101350 RepID=UPI003B518711
MSAADPTPFTWELPGDARIVALVFQGSEAERSATVVDAIATSVARRRGRTLVLNSESGPSPLDELAGAPERADSGGMAAFLAGQSGLARVAVRRADCPYVYLPVGQVPEGVVDLLESPALGRFVSRVKEGGGTLFVAMSEHGRPSPDLLGLLDGYIAVGSVPPADRDLRCYGLVPFESSAAPGPTPVEDAAAPQPEPEPQPQPDPEAPSDPEPPSESAEPPPEPALQPALEPEPDAAAEPPAPPSAAPGASASAASARARGRRSRASLAAALAIAALAVGNWWAYRNGWLDSAISRVGSMIAAGEEAPAAAATAATPAEGGPAAEAGSVAEDGLPAGDRVAAGEAGTPTDPPDVAEPVSIPQVPDEAAVAAAFESAAERPYSVLLGSFTSPVDAAERVAEFRALHGGTLYFMAPTTIRGSRYQRILAGAIASETEASALMGELVAAGAVEEANAWLLRPVRFAYDLGVFADRSLMEARIAELASLGVPAYGLATTLDGTPIFRVYGGAYEDEEAAAPMSDVLEAAGESATLIVRRGDAIPSTR